jgi:hypothetical protein
MNPTYCPYGRASVVALDDLIHRYKAFRCLRTIDHSTDSWNSAFKDVVNDPFTRPPAACQIVVNEMFPDEMRSQDTLQILDFCIAIAGPRHLFFQ